MKCPECGKNCVEEISSRLKTIEENKIIMRLETPGFEWRCKCGYTQDWQEETLKIISFEQKWAEANPLPCPDCEGTGHLVYSLMRFHQVKHCPRCKGSGEVVQE